MKKFIPFLFLLVSGVASAQVTHIYYGDTVALPYCGGTINAGCGDRECFVNIQNTTCAGVRLDDKLSYNDLTRDYDQFDRSYLTRSARLQETYYGSGRYNSTYGQLPMNPGAWYRDVWRGLYRGFPWYATVFVHRTDQDQPYDKVIVHFYKKPGT